MKTEILMPSLSPTMEEGSLAKWYVSPGDKVKPGDIIADIETDKALMEYESIEEGTILDLLVEEGTENIKVLENIDVMLTVEVGRTEITIRDLLRLNEGSVVELDRLAGDPLDIMVNNTKIAKGEVVMVGERFGVRFGEIVDPEKRMESI